MYDTAWRQQPANDDLAIQTFSANARTGNWKAAQQARHIVVYTVVLVVDSEQVAARMHKQFQEDRFLYWSVFCAVLQVRFHRPSCADILNLTHEIQANDPATVPALKPVLYNLALRLISSAKTPSYVTSDRFYVHLVVLKELGKFEEASALLESEAGKARCTTSLVCDELRREIWKLKGGVKDEGQRAQDKVLKEGCVRCSCTLIKMTFRANSRHSLATVTGWSSCLSWTRHLQTLRRRRVWTTPRNPPLRSPSSRRKSSWRRLRTRTVCETGRVLWRYLS